MVHAPASPPVCPCSLYLEHSVGLDSTNSGALAKLGEFLSNIDCKFIVAGGFNFNPKVLHSLGFVCEFGAHLVHSD
eukprot:580612-Pyramimonas_sp.AAC.1